MNLPLALRAFTDEDGEFDMNLDQMTSLATNPNSGLGTKERIRLEWGTHTLSASTSGAPGYLPSGLH